MIASQMTCDQLRSANKLQYLDEVVVKASETAEFFNTQVEAVGVSEPHTTHYRARIIYPATSESGIKVS
jgi:hypothetical protein